MKSHVCSRQVEAAIIVPKLKDNFARYLPTGSQWLWERGTSRARMELKGKIRSTGSEEKLRQLKSTWRNKKIFSTLLLKQREATAKTSCALSRLIASHSGPFTGCQFIQERLIESGKTSYYLTKWSILPKQVLTKSTMAGCASDLVSDSRDQWKKHLVEGNTKMCLHKEKFNEIQQFIKICIILYLYEAQHVSDDTPPIIGSLKLHWQPLVFHTWKVVGRVVWWTLSGTVCSWWWAVCRPKHVELHINME